MTHGLSSPGGGGGRVVRLIPTKRGRGRGEGRGVWGPKKVVKKRNINQGGGKYKKRNRGGSRGTSPPNPEREGGLLALKRSRLLTPRGVRRSAQWGSAGEGRWGAHGERKKIGVNKRRKIRLRDPKSRGLGLFSGLAHLLATCSKFLCLFSKFCVELFFRLGRNRMTQPIILPIQLVPPPSLRTFFGPKK